MAGMDLAAICSVLAGTQQADGAAREAAEQRLKEASSGSPNQLVCALVSVLGAAGNVGTELRQEAAVILRQLVAGSTTRVQVWPDLDEAAKKTLMRQLLNTLEHDPSNLVKRNAGQVASEVAAKVADDFSELTTEWPEFLPALSRFIGATSNSATRVVALQALKDLVPQFGEGFMAQGEQVTAMLMATLGDEASEVRAASAELVLQLIEDLEPEDIAPLTKVMPAVIAALQGFAKAAEEVPLKDTLQALVMAIDEEPEFFKENGIETLWPTLIEISSVGPQVFADAELRHSAMEAAMSLATGLPEDFSKPEGQPLLERLFGINIEWMLEVEEDVDAWTQEGKEDNDDECDDDVVGIAEENLDRLASKLDENVFMPLLFKLIRAACMAPVANWKHARAALMAIHQVVEHLVENAWVDQCVEYIAQNLNHAHPRVRYAAFGAVSQIAYDHSPHVQEEHHELLLPAIVVGIKDVNIRVATNAVDAFASMGDGLDCEDLQPHVDELLSAMFSCLHQGQTRAIQESCLSGVATVAEVLEELFEPYYSNVIPTLKQIIASAVGEKDRSLRGKAFECVSILGSVVSKEMFAQDAHEVMQQMMQMLQAGFAADDPQRESVTESSSKIAEKLGKDFKPYVSGLLPVVFEALKHRPKEVEGSDMPDDDDDDEQEDMSLTVVEGKIFGLKTSVLEEMKDALDLCNTLVESLEEEFCEFLPATCQTLLPLLELQLSEDLREKAFKTWELLAECARRAVECGRIDKSVLQELVTKFLETIVGAMAAMAQGDALDSSSCTMLHARAVGVSGVIRKAGLGVLTKDGVRNIASILMQLLSKIECAKDEPAEPTVQRRRGAVAPEEDEEDDKNEDGAAVTRQSVRFTLVDVAGALMRTNADDFAEVALAPYMQFVQALLRQNSSESDRSLAFYITDDFVDCLGEKSVPFWAGFMNQALAGMVDKSAMVRQYASNTIGNAARQPIFAQMATAAASQIHRVLQKQGERHRRRRAVKADAKQTALAVDAGIRALGEICQHHEQQMGEHAGVVWSMWLTSLPLKYDEEGGQKAHKQLLDLVTRNHPAITAPQQLPHVVTVFAEVYKTKFSNVALDKEIRSAMASIGEAPLKELCSNIQEKHQKKVEQILQGAKAGA